MIHCLVIDDDAFSRLELSQCVKRTDGLTLSAACSSATEALEHIRQGSIDVVFLDVEMPEMSGFELINTFKDIPQIVMVTGKADYAAEAFDADVTDFLVKPLSYPRFLKAIEKVKQVMESIKPADEKPNHPAVHLFLKTSTTYVKIEVSDIRYIEAFGDYVNIYMGKGRHTVLTTMKTLESRLPKQDFVRTHRAFIVNLHFVSEIEDGSLSLEGKILPVSRHYKDELMKRIDVL